MERTIFLQLLSDDYRKLVDGLCFAINETYRLANKESDADLRSIIDYEAKELETILKNLGDQVAGQDA